MGKLDMAAKEFMRNNAVCADLINLGLYQGKQVVTADDLSELDGTELISILYWEEAEDEVQWDENSIRQTEDGVQPVGNLVRYAKTEEELQQGKDSIRQINQMQESWNDKTEKPNRTKRLKQRTEKVQRYRDVLKRVTKPDGQFGIHLIVGLEEQSNIHYAMPVRCELYDAINYADQVKKIGEAHRAEKTYGNSAEFLSGFQKTDHLIPVVTIVVYFGTDTWDAAKSLHDMICWNGIPEAVREMIPNYRIALLEPQALADDVLAELPSCAGSVLGAIKHSAEKEDFQSYIEEHQEQFQSLPAYAAGVLNEFCNLELELDERKGDVTNMCQAILEIKEESRAEGRREGEEIGRQTGRREGEEIGRQTGRREGRIYSLIETCQDLGVSYEETQTRLMEKISLNALEAKEAMELYWQ